MLEIAVVVVEFGTVMFEETSNAVEQVRGMLLLLPPAVTLEPGGGRLEEQQPGRASMEHGAEEPESLDRLGTMNMQ